jgi:RHS repeat-associated protein
MTMANQKTPYRYARSAGLLIAVLLLSCTAGGNPTDDVAQTAAAVSLSITLSNEIGRAVSTGNGLARRFVAYDARGRDIAAQHVLDNTSYVYTTAYGYPQSAISVTGPGTVVSSMTYPDGESVAYTYDAGGAAQTVKTTPSGGTQQPIVTKQVRNARGWTIEVDYGDGLDQVHCYNETSDLRLNAIKVGTWSGTPSCTTAASSLVQSYGYTFDPDANVTAVEDYCTATIPGVCCDPAGESCPAQAMSATYAYDSRGELTTATSNGTTNDYSYDNAGNLTCMDGTAAGCGNQTYPTQGAGSVHPHAVSSSTASGSSVTFAYDANGNTTSTSAGQTITWNPENMATQVLSGSTQVNQKWFVGEAEWKKVEGGTTTYYLPSLRNEGGGYRKYYGSFAERDWTDRTSCTVNAKLGCLKFYHSDHLGSSAVATTSTGTPVYRHSYWPYGGDRSIVGSFTPKYQFNFKEKDASGFYDYGARMYNDVTGRWLSADSVLTEAAYAYANNNPLFYTDPTGHNTQTALLIVGEGTDGNRVEADLEARGVHVIYRINLDWAGAEPDAIRQLKEIPAGMKFDLVVMHSHGGTMDGPIPLQTWGMEPPPVAERREFAKDVASVTNPGGAVFFDACHTAGLDSHEDPFGNTHWDYARDFAATAAAPIYVIGLKGATGEDNTVKPGHPIPLEELKVDFFLNGGHPPQQLAIFGPGGGQVSPGVYTMMRGNVGELPVNSVPRDFISLMPPVQ